MRNHILSRPCFALGRKMYFSIQIIIVLITAENESRKARNVNIKAKIKTHMLQVTELRS